MTADHASEPVPSAVPGATIFTGRALQRLAVGIAHDIAGVPVRDVTVSLSDDRGGLRVAVTVPAAVSADGEKTLEESGDTLRRGLIEGMRDLGDRHVSIVDIRYSGVRRNAEKRVR